MGDLFKEDDKVGLIPRNRELLAKRLELALGLPLDVLKAPLPLPDPKPEAVG